MYKLVRTGATGIPRMSPLADRSNLHALVLSEIGEYNECTELGEPALRTFQVELAA